MELQDDLKESYIWSVETLFEYQTLYLSRSNFQPIASVEHFLDRRKNGWVVSHCPDYSVTGAYSASQWVGTSHWLPPSEDPRRYTKFRRHTIAKFTSRRSFFLVAFGNGPHSRLRGRSKDVICCLGVPFSGAA
jgi:hypothetical protein